MRISDWSSDVCSSDLPSRSRATRCAGGRFGRCVRDARSHSATTHSACVIAARKSAGPASAVRNLRIRRRSEEHTSELQSLMRISYAVFCLKKKTKKRNKKKILRQAIYTKRQRNQLIISNNTQSRLNR